MAHSAPPAGPRPTSSRSLNMRQLEIFHAIMTVGTMSGAALALHVSQPALSRALAHCESRLGYALFVRLGRRLQPTPEALRLHEEAREVYKGLDRLNILAHRLGSSGASTLNIVASATFANSLVPLTLQQLARHSPDIRIDFRTATYDELPTYLLSEQAEVGVSLVESQHPGLKSQRVGQQRLVCVLPLQHPLANHASIEPRQLMDSAWIGYPPDTPFGRLCATELGMDSASALIQVRSPAIALSFAQMGLGAAIVDTSCLSFSQASHCIAKPLSTQALSDIWVTTSARYPCSAIGRQFIDTLRSTLQRLG